MESNEEWSSNDEDEDDEFVEEWSSEYETQYRDNEFDEDWSSEVEEWLSEDEDDNYDC